MLFAFILASIGLINCENFETNNDEYSDEVLNIQQKRAGNYYINRY
jgi:hypothetical protein